MTDKYTKALEAYTQTGSQRKAAAKMGIPRRTFRNYYNKALSQIHGTPVGFKTTKVSTDANGQVTARTHKLAPEITESKFRNQGDVIKTSTLYGADGNVTGEWVIRSHAKEAPAQSVLDGFKEEVLRAELTPEPIVDIKSDKLNVLIETDEHYNMKTFGWDTESDFDMKKAVNLHLVSFKHIVDRMPNAETFWWFRLGDVSEANDHMGVTPRSKHPVVEDLPFGVAHKIIANVERLKVNYLLQRFPKVELDYVSGNHDDDASFHLAHAMELCYENEPRLKVNYHAKGYFAKLFQDTIMGADHGHQGKVEDLANVVIQDYKDEFAQSSFRYLHRGHYHTPGITSTFGDFQCFSHGTLIPRGKFAFSNKMKSPKIKKGFTVEKNQGIIAEYNYNIAS